MAVPYTFGSATSSIPLSQLDSNFATAITLGNTAIQLGNTVTTLNNMTLANVTISSGNVTITSVTLSNANITGTTTLSGLTASTALALDASKNITSVTNTGTGNNVLSASPTLTGTTSIATLNLTNALGTGYGGTGLTSFTANGVVYASSTSALATGSALVYDGSNFGLGAAPTAYSSYRVQTITGPNTTYGGLIDLSVSDRSSIFRLQNDLNTAQIGTLTAHPLVFNYNGSEQMRLTSTGLGIGTSSPAYKLDVGNATANSTQLAGTTGGTYIYGIGRNGVNGAEIDSYDAITFRTGSTSGARTGSEKMRLDQSGNLGLGVTPSANSLTSSCLDLANGFGVFGYNNGFNLSSNAYYNGGWKYKATAYANLYVQSNGGGHQWNIAPSGTAGNAITFTQAMTLTAGGALLVGWTTAPSASSQLFANAVQCTNTSGGGGFLNIGTSGGGQQFYTHTGVPGSETYTERARIDSSGNLLVNQTTNPAVGKIAATFAGNTTNGIELKDSTDTTGAGYIVFRNSGGTAVGSITRSTGNTVLYNVSSDYRLKTVIGAVSGSGERIDALEPIEYTWKSDNSQTRGFLAHKFQEVYPQSVSGEKDAVDADGNPKYQAMQPSTPEVIADLVAEIQSLRQRVLQLESK